MIPILGLDPGNVFGYAIVTLNEDGSLDLTTSGIWNLNLVRNKLKYYTIFSNVKNLITQYSITYVSMETAFVGKAMRMDTAIKIGEKRGAAMSAIEMCCASEAINISPSFVKKAVTGSGRSDKSEVKSKICEMFGYSPENDNESDAIAIAVAALKHIQNKTR